MTLIDKLSDAGKFASEQPTHVSLEVQEWGILIVVSDAGRQSRRFISWLVLEDANINPLIEAIKLTQRSLALVPA